VNEEALLCAKISFFKKHLAELNLVAPNHLETAQKAEKVTNAFQVSQLFSYCAERKLFKEFYQIAHKLNLDGF